MEGHQMPAAIALGQTAHHRLDNLFVGVSFDRPITAQDPDDIGGVLIPLPEPAAEDLGILRREDLRTDTPLLVPLVAPGREKADIHAERFRLVHDVIDMIPVIVIRAVLDVGLRRIVVQQRPMPICIRGVQPVQLGQRHRLNHRETVGRPVLEVFVRLLAVEPVEQFPRRIAQPEERRPVLVDEEPLGSPRPLQPRQIRIKRQPRRRPSK
jgi:hypothetical protein